MLHKISDFCLKVDGLKKTSDRLYNIKYNNPKIIRIVANKANTFAFKFSVSAVKKELEEIYAYLVIK